MKSADDLRRMSHQTAADLSERERTKKDLNTQALEIKIQQILMDMEEVFETETAKLETARAGKVMVKKIPGDLGAEGSAPWGIDQAWARLQAKLGPLGYSFKRWSSYYTETGAPDGDHYIHHTYFEVSW
jgi:hypothetical protein